MIKLFPVFLLLFSQLLAGYGEANENFSLSKVDISALSRSEREVLRKLNVVYLEKLELPSTLDVNLDRLYGYTSLKKNSVGVCIYQRYIFNSEKLLDSEATKERYVGSLDSDCGQRLKNNFVLVSSVPDKTASLILSSFEKSNNDLSKIVSFDGLDDSVKGTIYKHLVGATILSIGYKYIEHLDVGCLVVRFKNNEGRLDLLGDFERSTMSMEVLLIGTPIS